MKITYSTNIDPSGYSSCARAYIKSIYKNPRCEEIKIIINNVARNINSIGIDIKDLEFFSGLSVKKSSEDSILVQHTVPDRMIFGNKKNILYTVVEMECPDKWVYICNNCDLVLTASFFCKEIMSSCGIKEDIIKVVPHCLDLDIWNEKVIPLNISNLKDFNFLFVGDYTPRKNGDILIQSFLKTFRGRTDVSLTMKAYYNSFSLNDQENLVNRMKVGIEKSGVPLEERPPIYFYGDPILESLMPRFMSSFDCLVSPHRGEGFGLCMAQMMALGKSVISTRYSGNLEYMNDSNSFLVEIKDKKEPVPQEMAIINPNFIGKEWVAIEEESLEKQMLLVSNNKKERDLRSLSALESIKGFSSNRISNLFLDSLEGIL